MLNMDNTVGIIREIMSARLGDKRTAALRGLVTAITRSSSIAKMIMFPLWDDVKNINPMALQIIVLMVTLYFDVPYTTYIYLSAQAYQPLPGLPCTHCS